MFLKRRRGFLNLWGGTEGKKYADNSISKGWGKRKRWNGI
jgi:hypothetical protein